jgi:proteasome lid subunit RPN8/RPN11
VILESHVIAAAQAHALAEYPKESCGVVVGTEYIACANTAADPLKDFRIDPLIYAKLLARGPVRAILHSHPDGPFYPSKHDMTSQLATAVPWGVIATDGERASLPVMWGDQLPIRPLIGREFMHGVLDCYALIRDAYRLGPHELERQGIADWPHAPVTLPEFPREDAWWEAGEDLYRDHFAEAGFRPVERSEVQPGDVFVMKLLTSKKLNHGGLYVGNNLILHHLPSRLSRREPAGLWMRQFELWLRYEGAHA